MLMNYHIGRLVLSSLCVGAFGAGGFWWCSFCRLKPEVHTPYLGKPILLTYVHPVISITFILLFISIIIHSLLQNTFN